MRHLTDLFFSRAPWGAVTTAPANRTSHAFTLLSMLVLCAATSTAANASGQSAAQSEGRQRSQATALSQDARDVLSWVRQSGNNAQLPFVLVDKRHAAVHVFDSAGVRQASSPALLGLARGDHSVPGIGERPMSQIAPHERTTPAGRFASEPGRNLQGEDIVWIHYDDAVSLHRVRPSHPAERRLQRLVTGTAADNRISFGCVNLPVPFYDRFVAPTLGQQPGVIYVLPETQPVGEFFGFAPATHRR